MQSKEWWNLAKVWEERKLIVKAAMKGGAGTEQGQTEIFFLW